MGGSVHRLAIACSSHTMLASTVCLQDGGNAHTFACVITVKLYTLYTTVLLLLQMSMSSNMNVMTRCCQGAGSSCDWTAKASQSMHLHALNHHRCMCRQCPTTAACVGSADRTRA